MSEAIEELAALAEEQAEAVREMGHLDTVAMIITIADDNGIYRVEADARSEQCLRLLLTAMNQEGPLRMSKVAEIPMEIYQVLQAERKAREAAAKPEEPEAPVPETDEIIH